jgi:6-phosphogluconolactonase
MASAFAFLAIVLSAAAQSPGAGKFFLYSGHFHKPRTSKGIYVYWYDSTSGMTELLRLTAESPSPTFLAVHPNHRFLYAVNEISNFVGGHPGSVTAFSIDAATGRLTQLNAVQPPITVAAAWFCSQSGPMASWARLLASSNTLVPV